METTTGLHLDPTAQALLIALVLCTCLACLWMVFFFGRRLQTSAYLRDSLVVAVREEERKVLIRGLLDRAIAGPLDAKKPPPDGFGPPAQLWDPGKWVPYQDRLGDENYHGPSGETPEQRDERQRKLMACKLWEAEERERYGDELQRLEKEAQHRAEKRIPVSMDISLLGGGWSFLLEFSTVIVLIFTLLALGIGGAVAGKDITTILASIAGYVLGKATGAARGSGHEAPSGRIADGPHGGSAQD